MLMFFTDKIRHRYWKRRFERAKERAGIIFTHVFLAKPWSAFTDAEKADFFRAQTAEIENPSSGIDVTNEEL